MSTTMRPMAESERVEALERQIDDLIARLATAHKQTELAIANTDRSIAQTTEALAQAQRFMKLYQDEVAKHAPFAASNTSQQGEK